MLTSKLTPEERELFSAVVNVAMAKAKRANIRLPTNVMCDRLTRAWDAGERDPQKLEAAALSAEIVPLLALGRYFTAGATFPVDVRSKT